MRAFKRLLALFAGMFSFRDSLMGRYFVPFFLSVNGVCLRLKPMTEKTAKKIREVIRSIHILVRVSKHDLS